MEMKEIVKTIFREEPQSVPEAQIAAAKERFPIPPALEQFWHVSASLSGSDKLGDSIVDTDFSLNLGSSDELTLFTENAGTFNAYIRQKDLSLPDPPVYIWKNTLLYTDYEDPTEYFCAPAVSEFLKGMMFYEALWHGFPEENRPASMRRLRPLSDMPRLQEHLPRRQARLLNWMDQTFTFYCPFPGAVLAVIDAFAETRVCCGAATPGGHAALMELLSDLGEPIQ